MFYLIAFYHRVVELWCHAKNFPNAPRIYGDEKNHLFDTDLLSTHNVSFTTSWIKARFIGIGKYKNLCFYAQKNNLIRRIFREPTT